MTSNLPCFKCGKTIELEPHTEGLRYAMSFISYGGYGSRIYDPYPPGHYLRIHICDDCVTTGAEQGTVLEATVVKRPAEVTYKKWEPPRTALTGDTVSLPT